MNKEQEELWKQREMKLGIYPEPRFLALAKSLRQHPLDIEGSRVPLMQGDVVMPLLRAQVVSLQDPRAPIIEASLRNYGLQFPTQEESYYALHYIYAVSLAKQLGSGLPIPEEEATLGVTEETLSRIVDIVIGRFYAIEDELERPIQKRIAEGLGFRPSLTRGMGLTRERMMETQRAVEEAFQRFSEEEAVTETKIPEFPIPLEQVQEILGQIESAISRMRSDASAPANDRRTYPNRLAEKVDQRLSLRTEPAGKPTELDVFLVYLGILIEKHKIPQMVAYYKKLTKRKIVPASPAEFLELMRGGRKDWMLTQSGLSRKDIQRFTDFLEVTERSGEVRAHIVSTEAYLYIQLFDLIQTAMNYSPDSVKTFIKNVGEVKDVGEMNSGEVLGLLISALLLEYVHPTTLQSLLDIDKEAAQPFRKDAQEG